MLALRQITKVYSGGEMQVKALRGIDLDFSSSEFVAILGPSGCGKTTLLNIIGGLDQYTEGDLVIRGKSTKQFKESDWDTYRNHAVGFVFQSYNLIPHQTVLANVELALTLSGIGREERRRRAKEALEKVGLADQLRKKPNELSGGQMQRVAIARALVNNPEILLADEPTGALDSETSVQVMEILREIGRERLVIMVTHNPDLANEYADRIIRVLDGKVTSDSRIVREAAPERTAAAGSEEGKKKRSMSILTALNLSLTNLMTKKGRTLLTAFAGSIGIIGIALILSISNGVNEYIERVQRDTLSAYPLQINAQSMDMTETLNNLFDASEGEVREHEVREHGDGKIYSGTRMTNTMSAMMSGVKENDLASFKAWLDDPANGIGKLVSGIQYEYETPLVIYRTDHGLRMQVNPSTTMESTGMMDMWNMGAAGAGIQQTMMETFTKRLNVFEPLLDNDELLKSQYEILSGRMPESMYEVVLILNRRNELSDYTLYSLGLKDQGELRGQFTELMQGNGIKSEDLEFTYRVLLEGHGRGRSVPGREAGGSAGAEDRRRTAAGGGRGDHHEQRNDRLPAGTDAGNDPPGVGERHRTGTAGEPGHRRVHGTGIPRGGDRRAEPGGHHGDAGADLADGREGIHPARDDPGRAQAAGDEGHRDAVRTEGNGHDRGEHAGVEPGKARRQR